MHAHIDEDGLVHLELDLGCDLKKHAEQTEITCPECKSALQALVTHQHRPGEVYRRYGHRMTPRIVRLTDVTEDSAAIVDHDNGEAQAERIVLTRLWPSHDVIKAQA